MEICTIMPAMVPTCEAQPAGDADISAPANALSAGRRQGIHFSGAKRCNVRGARLKDSRLQDLIAALGRGAREVGSEA